MTNKEISSKLLDLGELGTDAERFIKVRAFMQGLCDDRSPQGQKFLDAFNLVHRAFKLVGKE